MARSGRRRRRVPWHAYVFLAPFFVLFAVFFVYPVLYAIALSFQRWSAASTTWVGLDNYTYVLGLPAIRQAFANIVWYGIVNNVYQVSIALVLAILLDQAFLRRVAGALRVAIFLPNIVPGIITALVFAIILGTGGIVDHVLSTVGIHIAWLQSATWAKPAVIIAGGWRYIGYWVLIITAGLQGVPREHYESAQIDGANAFQQVIHVSIPFIRPVLAFVIIVNTIGTMNLFEEPFLLLTPSGGALNAGTTPTLEIYKLGFQNFNPGAAAAVGWLLCIIVVVLSSLQLWLAQRREWLE